MLLQQFLMLLGGIFAGGACGLPLSTPPLPADPVIERSAPDACLMHVSLRGLALPAADGRNLTERMLADEEVQDFLGSLARQLVPLAEGAATASDPAALDQARAVAGIDIDRDLLRAVGDDWRVIAFQGSILPVPDIAIAVGDR